MNLHNLASLKLIQINTLLKNFNKQEKYLVIIMQRNSPFAQYGWFSDKYCNFKPIICWNIFKEEVYHKYPVFTGSHKIKIQTAIRQLSAMTLIFSTYGRAGIRKRKLIFL